MSLFWTRPSIKNFYEITQIQSNLPSSTTRVCTEFKEISVDTYTENRVLSGDSRFIYHDPVSTREGSLKSLEAVSRTFTENTSVDFRINKTDRLISLQLFKQYFQHK